MIILYIILALIALPFIIALFIANEYTLEEETIIKRPVQQVFDYVKLLETTNYWSKWVMTDPHMKKVYKGTDGTVGASYAWESDNKQVGQGEQEITKIVNGQRIDYEIRFIKPFAGTSWAWITTEAMPGNQTKVKWFFKGSLNYFMRLLHLVLNLKKVLAKDMATSLSNLKTILEKTN